MLNLCKCQHCDKLCEAVKGDVIYPHLPHLHDRWFWKCHDCEAWVGCHQNTRRPKGTAANANLRRLRIVAHAAFDPLWRSKWMTRDEAYQALADELQIEREGCHIGQMDEDTCRRIPLAVEGIKHDYA